MLPMRRTFHPCALIRIPRDISKVEEGIDFLKGSYIAMHMCVYAYVHTYMLMYLLLVPVHVGKVSNDSAFMECVKKARNDTSDVHNLLMAILFRDEHKLCDYLERCHDKVTKWLHKTELCRYTYVHIHRHRKS